MDKRYQAKFNQVIDLHCHIQDPRDLSAWRDYFSQLPADYAYQTVVVASHYDQAAWLFPAILEDPILNSRLIPMAGLHPWQAGLGRAGVDRLRPYLAQSPFVGEIGLDKIWCDVPLDQQVDVLLYQLEIAQALAKPILLHSKGYEAELLDLVHDYLYPIIVHWYSCEDPDLLQAYIDRGCHFTLASDQGRDPGTRLLWQLAPADRIHLETDGYEALIWAQEEFGPGDSLLGCTESTPDRSIPAQPIPVGSIPAISIPAQLLQSLENSVETYANLHGLKAQQAAELFYHNSQDLLAFTRE